MTTAAATQSASLVESYARGATDVPLIEQTIGAFFADMVARQPDREALVSVHQGRRYTYAQLQTEAHRLASALLGLGLAPGGRMAAAGTAAALPAAPVPSAPAVRVPPGHRLYRVAISLGGDGTACQPDPCISRQRKGHRAQRAAGGS